MNEHWDKVYHDKDVERLGWYEALPKPSLDLIRKCKLDSKANILNVGAGASTLVDELLSAGYQNLVVNDISAEAISALQSRLGSEKSKKINWIIDDLTNPSALHSIGQVDLWFDRAVLHFFTAKDDRDNYFHLLKDLVKVDGYVIIAVFNLNGAEQCSGLPIFRYNDSMIQENLGTAFSLLHSFDNTYTMPSGNEREYIYTLFRRDHL